MVNINFRSVINKVPQLVNMIDSIQPDIIIGTETWLHKGVYSSEIFPEDYIVYRKDRDSKGGGVLVAVKKDLKSLHVTELDSDC